MHVLLQMLLMMESVFGLKERNSTILVLLLSHCPQVLIKVLKALMDYWRESNTELTI